MRHGKHRCMTFSELARSERDYVSWVLRSDSLPTSLREFARFVRSEFGGMLTVGKHRMSYFTEILERDPAYCVWVAQLVSLTGSAPNERYQLACSLQSKRNKNTLRRERV